jgi:hypothetical protein
MAVTLAALLVVPAWFGPAAADPAKASRVVWGPGGVGAVAPPPGHWVEATFDLADGTALTLFARTPADGSAPIASPPRDGISAPEAAAATGACSDPAYAFGGGRWRQTLQWYFNSRATPPLLGVPQAEAAMRDATRNITAAQNDCGRRDAVTASHGYRGRAAYDPNVVGTVCLGADGVNVVGWTALPQPILAGTCNYGLGLEIVESDVVVNALTLWYRSKPASCAQQFDLTAVMTHERGHSFGLGHVAESSHPSLTMSTQTGGCDGSASTLGLGDMLGLEALYP